VALPRITPDKPEVKLGFNYVLVPNEAPKQSVRLIKTTSVVGREAYCDIVFNDHQVSRKHCLLEIDEQNVKVSDLESSNGTFVNGVLIRKGLLKEGDSLGLGAYKLTLHKEQKKAPDLPSYGSLQRS